MKLGAFAGQPDDPDSVARQASRPEEVSRLMPAERRMYTNRGTLKP